MANHKILIIEEDEQIGAALAAHFVKEDYEALSSATGAEGVQMALAQRPSLILLAAQLSDQSGLDVFQSLRDTPRTAHIPVMVLAGRGEVALQNQVLEAGAYDFLEKPVDVDILTLRVRNALRRAEREGLTEPRTGLPTGRLIAEHADSLASTPGWYRINLKIDEFNTFRDLYGFVTANEALRFAGNLICQVVQEQGEEQDFVGHETGAEEFVVFTTQAKGSTLRQQLVQRLREELAQFYNFMERDQGYVLIDDGTGKQAQKPLMSAQVSVSQGTPDPDAPAASTEDDPWEDAVEPDEESSPASDDPFDW